VQAAINGKVIARADVKAVRKDVLSQVLRWRYQPQAQASRQAKEGKKRMKTIGSVEVPQEAFMTILSIDDE
jgi:GTP-binding protein LepA